MPLYGTEPYYHPGCNVLNQIVMDEESVITGILKTLVMNVLVRTIGITGSEGILVSYRLKRPGEIQTNVIAGIVVERHGSGRGLTLFDVGHVIVIENRG